MATMLIGGLLVIVFAIDFPYHDLVTSGYISGASLRHGDWWRLATAPLLHLDSGHIVNNLFALGLVGLRTEPLIGSRSLAAIFAVSAGVGALGSAALNPPNVLSVGASGAIQGLFSALYVAGLSRGRRTEEGRTICRDALVVGVLGMAYASSSEFFGQAFGVDLAAHICGGLAGMLAAVAMLTPDRVITSDQGILRATPRAWRVGAAGLLAGATLLLTAIVVLRPALPYTAIHIWGTVLLLSIAAAVLLHDTLSSPASTTSGAPFSFRRLIHTQGKMLALLLSLAAIWVFCMQTR